MARKTLDEAAATRADLITAAINVFATQGYVNATLEMIASQAHVSRGAVYWHFSGKRALLKHILESHSLPFEEFFSDHFSLKEALQALRVAVVSTVTQQPSRQLCEIMLCNSEGRARFSLIAARFSEAQSRFSDQVRRMLVQAIELGELHASLDVDATCQLMRIVLAGLILECLSQDAPLDGQVFSSLEAIWGFLSGGALTLVGLRAPNGNVPTFTTGLPAQQV
ncbi:TetR family transcriptional regulator [Pseudomonas putida]